MCVCVCASLCIVSVTHTHTHTHIKLMKITNICLGKALRLWEFLMRERERERERESALCSEFSVPLPVGREERERVKTGYKGETEKRLSIHMYGSPMK